MCTNHNCCSEEVKSNQMYVHLIQFIAFEYGYDFMVAINDARHSYIHCCIFFAHTALIDSRRSVSTLHYMLTVYIYIWQSMLLTHCIYTYMYIYMMRLLDSGTPVITMSTLTFQITQVHCSLPHLPHLIHPALDHSMVCSTKSRSVVHTVKDHY